MENANPLLWLAWACFGTFLAGLLWKQYLPALRRAPESLPSTDEIASAAPPAWLICEEGTALDRRVRWFPLRPGGRTVFGGRPRAAAGETSFIYLTADDIREDHVVVSYDARQGRYLATVAGDAPVTHNNEALPAGRTAGLADGDTLDLGQISRFRFTLTGPESP